MTLASSLKSRIDALWLEFHSGGITNPITIIEQISYLMFARLFVHANEFEWGQRRPKAGESVRFIQGIDSKGRSCARKVTFVKTGGRFGAGVWLLLSALLVLPLLALLKLPFPWWQGAGAMLIVSAITYGMYAHDKRQS